jgi:hypothetical protein
MWRVNQPPGHRLLLIGWAVFVVSIFLPINVSNGGFTDEGRPHVGLIHVLYSFVAWGAIIEGLPWEESDRSFEIIAHAVVGLFNLLMLFAPALLLLRGVPLRLARGVMAFGAVYVCTVGFLITRRHFELLFGFYVWCLSFVLVSAGLFIGHEPESEGGSPE